MSDKPNPMRTAQWPAMPDLPRRFYKRAEAGRHGNAFAVLLDGKVAKTPARRALAVGERHLAEALAREWEVQGEHIDPATMPLTRIVDAAIDSLAGELDWVRSDIVRYAGSDLVCYRAESPRSLIGAQAAAWDPLLVWAEEALGAPLVLAGGVVHVAQDTAVLAAIERALAPLDPVQLAALHAVTTLTGSAVIALALLRGRLSTDEASAAAHVDEDFQMSRWGRDETGLAGRALRRREIAAAALILGAA